MNPINILAVVWAISMTLFAATAWGIARLYVRRMEDDLSEARAQVAGTRLLNANLRRDLEAASWPQEKVDERQWQKPPAWRDHRGYAVSAETERN